MNENWNYGRVYVTFIGQYDHVMQDVGITTEIYQQKDVFEWFGALTLS